MWILCTAVVLLALLCHSHADAKRLPEVRGGFAATGQMAHPTGGPPDQESLVAFYDPVGTRLLPVRKLGPRVYCSADCSIRATVKLDLPGKSDPKAATFAAELIANHIYTATIAPTASDRARLIAALSGSRLVVGMTATDSLGRSDTDRRVFKFRRIG